MDTHFQKTIKELMAKNHLNQLELSRKLSIRQSQVSNWINGKSAPSYDSIKRLCLFFKISADELLDIPAFGGK